MALLELTDVHVSMGVQEILRGISIEVPERAIVAVLGGNGVGKTTLMRAISGIYGIASGSIRFDGQEIGNTPRTPSSATALPRPPRDARSSER